MTDSQFQAAQADFEQRRNERQYYEQQERLFAQDEINRKKLELEITNRYFIALATLSAASITLLIQHVFLSFDQYDENAKGLIRMSILSLAISLSASVVHNFLNSKIIIKDFEKLTISFLANVAVVTYLLGVGSFVVPVLETF